MCGCWGPKKGCRSAGVIVDLRQLTGMWDVPTGVSEHGVEEDI
jgi:hypothetical protein